MKGILREMLFELQSNRLEVVLIPQRNPPNRGACLRAPVATNCHWYRELCGDFESCRRRHYRNFKTRVKRREIERILKRLIAGIPTDGIYADWIMEYAKRQLSEVQFDQTS